MQALTQAFSPSPSAPLAQPEKDSLTRADCPSVQLPKETSGKGQEETPILLAVQEGLPGRRAVLSRASGVGIDECPCEGRWSPGTLLLWENEQDSGAEGQMGQCEQLPR